MVYSPIKIQNIDESEFKLVQLSESEINQFIEDGFVVVRKLFPDEYAERITSLIWEETGMNPNNPASQEQYHYTLKKILNKYPIPQIFSQQYQRIVNQLCGQGRWECDDGLGYWFITFPCTNQSVWYPFQKEWHIDGNRTHYVFDDFKLGLIAFHLITNVSKGGGGTAIRIGSHKYIARILAKAGLKGFPYEELSQEAVFATKDLPYIEITGQCGDVLFMHPLSVHTRSLNTSRQVRIAGHKFFHLFEPLDIKRRYEQEHSPAEKSILKALSETDK